MSAVTLQRCGCGTLYACPSGVALSGLACPKCGQAPGMDPGGAFVFVDERPPDLPDARPVTWEHDDDEPPFKVT